MLQATQRCFTAGSEASNQCQKSDNSLSADHNVASSVTPCSRSSSKIHLTTEAPDRGA